MGRESLLTNSGEFAEDLGEDFLGLRELGIDKEFGLASVNVPRALFFGRRRRANAEAADDKADRPDYAPPPPVIPLSSTTYTLYTPGLLHSFYAQRIESGMGVDKDEPFDAAQGTIGPLGQIVLKPLPGATPAKKKKDGDEKKEKKSVKK